LEFIGEAEVTYTVPLDQTKEMQDAYDWGNDGAYGPYPRHVVLNRDHEVTWLSRRYDASGLRQALDAVTE
jgi:hypothetical protein